MFHLSEEILFVGRKMSHAMYSYTEFAQITHHKILRLTKPGVCEQPYGDEHPYGHLES